jgi:hypothetical protein
MQLFSTSLALKFDPDVIEETFCFMPLKAEIHVVPVATPAALTPTVKFRNLTSSSSPKLTLITKYAAVSSTKIALKPCFFSC